MMHLTAFVPAITRSARGRPYGAALRARARGRSGNAPPAITGVVGFSAFLFGFFLWPKGILGSPKAELLGFLVVIVVPMIVADVLVGRTWRQPDAGLDLDAPVKWRRLASREAGLKMVGVVATMAVAWTYFTMVPMYRDTWYANAIAPFMNHVPVFTFLLAAYVAGLHVISRDGNDGWSEFGRFVLSGGARGDRGQVADHIGATLVKVFYLPLMFGFTLDDWSFFYSGPVTIISFQQAFDFLYRFIFFVDVTFGLIGYSISMRLFNAHVRWPEQRLSGWLICLMCYAPFWQVLGRNFFSYSDSITWGTLFPEGSFTYDLWGCLILLLSSLYSASTVSFGLRFSNLTYRGTVCNGPYAYVRHPAYLTKNLSWWLIELPFLATTPHEAMANTLGLIAVNLIYYVRARHEEACCALHADYRSYSRYLRRYSPVLRLARGLRAAARELVLPG